MKQDQKAFTLLELLVVMAIISVLASIAIPRFADYRRRAFDTRALSDLRNIATAEEVYFMDNEQYLSCLNKSCESLPGVTKLSQGVSLEMKATDKKDAFSGSASHSSGSGKVFHWDSEQGGFLEQP